MNDEFLHSVLHLSFGGQENELEQLGMIYDQFWAIRTPTKTLETHIDMLPIVIFVKSEALAAAFQINKARILMSLNNFAGTSMMFTHPLSTFLRLRNGAPTS